MDRAVSDADVAMYQDFDNRYLRQDESAGIERRALPMLPRIDVAAFANGADAARAAAAREIRKACIDIGFFYVEGHGIARADVETLIAFGRRFFALPPAEKTKLRWTGGRGYVPPGGLGTASARAADVKERLYFAREFPDAPADHLWPDEGALPGFRDFVAAFIAKGVGLANRMGRALALSLRLDQDYFARTHGPFGGTLVFNYYPPLDAKTVDPTQWSFSPHTDYGSYTLVFQDGLGGLQVRNAGGEWIDVVPVADTAIFNIGDLMALATNDLYTSNLHRVANFSPRERVSVTLFVGPPSTAEIGCLPTCEGPGNPARYPPVNADEYTKALVEAYHRTGRPGIAVQTAKRFERR